MSFAIALKTNTSPSNMVTKSLTDVVSVEGVLRRGTSVLDPIIEIETGLSEAIVGQINYAQIPAFGRYYYVTNIISTYNGLWELHMHVDVLMTYGVGIRAQNAIVARQAGQYNLYLNDGWFMAYQNPRIQTKYFSNATPFETQEFVLVLAGS